MPLVVKRLLVSLERWVYHVRRVRNVGILANGIFVDHREVRGVCIVLCINRHPFDTTKNRIVCTKSRGGWASYCAASRFSSSTVCLLLVLAVGSFGGGYTARVSSGDLLFPFALEFAAAARARPSLRVSNVWYTKIDIVCEWVQYIVGAISQYHSLRTGPQLSASPSTFRRPQREAQL